MSKLETIHINQDQDIFKYSEQKQKKERKLIEPPEIFKPFQIQLMIDTINHSTQYLKNDFGEWLKARDKAILMTIHLTTIPARDVCKLKFEDFNKETQSFHIKGSGYKKWGEEREIPIPDKLFMFYKEYFSFPRERFWRGSEYLFPSLESDHISPQSWKRIFREKILKAAGLYKRGKTKNKPVFTSDTLRITKGAQILSDSQDIFLVAKIMGFKKLGSTDRIKSLNEPRQIEIKEALEL